MARSELRSRRSNRGRVGVAVAIVVALPALIACNSLIGLSDFEKGQCAGARCVDEGGLPDQFVEGGVDGAQDALPDVRGSDPVSWAQWPMPNFGEGGAGLPLPSPALVAGVGIVTDPTTKLVWRSLLAPGDPTTPAEANGKCEAITDGGPWRAPKRIELVTLLDYSQKGFIDRTVFKDMNNFKLWTTSEVRPFVVGKADQPYWVVDFATGAVEPYASGGAAKVLCVRAK